MNLTHDDVQEILRLLDASPFDELILETDRFKLTLRRSGAGGWTQERQTLGAAHLSASARSPAATPQPAQASIPASQPAPRADVIEIRPPIMGTFYRAPQPGAAPYVEVGSRVAPDTVVGIVETMKLMNSVYAGAGGTVSEICAANGEVVDAQRVLMRLKPAGK
jgi:acetyl-CoA carboxylase biotin carboxyl carrier protein